MRERGFTLLEVLIAVLVLAAGAIGVMALLSSAMAGARVERRLERARALAAQTMEELRRAPPQAKDLPPVVEGVTYVRRARVAPAAGGLVMLTVTTGWIDGAPTTGDPFTDPAFHGARLHLLRAPEAHL